MNLRDLATVAILFVITGVALGIGSEVLDSVNSDVTAGSIANYAILNATEGVSELSSWMPTIGLVIAAGLIISIIFTSFAGKV